MLACLVYSLVHSIFINGLFSSFINFTYFLCWKIFFPHLVHYFRSQSLFIRRNCQKWSKTNRKYEQNRNRMIISKWTETDWNEKKLKHGSAEIWVRKSIRNSHTEQDCWTCTETIVVCSVNAWNTTNSHLKVFHIYIFEGIAAFSERIGIIRENERHQFRSGVNFQLPKNKKIRIMNI